MDLRESAGESEFRGALRSWLDRSLPPDWGAAGPDPRREDPAFLRDWSRLLFEAGYTGLTWPAAYGGRGLPYAYEAVFREETALAEAPEHIGVIGLGMVGPTIIAHGTEAQRTTYLASILSGDTVFCQGFSETEAGSDLAAVRCRARPRGDAFVVDGHKLWSSYAHLADHCLLLARTDPDSSGHNGLTCLLVDLRRPGVRVRPLRQITGGTTFNEISFDGVEVPRDAVLGGIGDGWRIAMTTLGHERGLLGFTLVARMDAMLRRLVTTMGASGAAGDPVLRDRLAGVYVDLQGLRFTNYRLAGGDAPPGPETSVAKLRWAETNQRLAALAVEVLGPAAALDADGWWRGYWPRERLRSRGNSIEGGTSEVLRSVLAERVLGLPRSR
ncbi:MAG TPA: acyl-CoA dehydrogenase family protein [Rugosimonospora sp.]|nr:acyl-CoA dehydrogenase family protein [Rugosimonospora sp.]